MSEQQKRLEKLRKLLALSEGTANEAEMLAALGKAMEYADKYGLSLEDAKNNPDERIEAGRMNVKSGWNEWSFLDAELGPKLCAFLRLKAVNAWQPKDGIYEITYVGEPAAVELFGWIRRTIMATYKYEKEVYEKFVHRDMPASERPTLDNARKSFLFGFCRKIQARIDEIMKARLMALSPTDRASRDALVVVTSALIEASIKKHGDVPVSYKTRSVGKVDMSAYGAGQAAGARVEMGRGVGKGGALRIGR